MTLPEFKAWFDGFTEDMPGRPTEKQWKRIKARVKEIDGAVITRHVWERSYWPYYFGPYIMPTGYVGSATLSSQCNNDLTSNSFTVSSNDLHAAGKAEYMAVVNEL